MPDLYNSWESGRTLRYHANPHLSKFVQTTADHSWGVLTIILVLHPNPSIQLVKAAQFHDSGERWAGDIPYPFKAEAPELMAEHEVVEARFREMMGIPKWNITKKEELWLTLADRLEAYIWCRLHDHQLAVSSSWQANNKKMLEMADLLGVRTKVQKIIEGEE